MPWATRISIGSNIAQFTHWFWLARCIRLLHCIHCLLSASRIYQIGVMHSCIHVNITLTHFTNITTVSSTLSCHHWRTYETRWHCVRNHHPCIVKWMHNCITVANKSHNSMSNQNYYLDLCRRIKVLKNNWCVENCKGI